MTPHDVVLDYIGTPEEVIGCHPSYSRPQGIFWDDVGDKLREIPILKVMMGEANPVR
jgi:hypothetical protein